MSDIIALTVCLNPYLNRTHLHHLCLIIFTVLAMNGRITMRGIARWAQAGLSERTIFRWFSAAFDWTSLLCAFVATHLLNPNGTYILAGDEVVVSKAGKATHGMGRFYSSIAQRVIPSVSFFALALVDVNQRRAYPISVRQRLPTPKTPIPEPAEPKVKRKPGRPKGSKNYARPAPILNAEFQLLLAMLQTLLGYLARWRVKYLVLDGHFGNTSGMTVAKQAGLGMISKLRQDAVLHFPYVGPQPARGPTPRYGDKLNYADLPETARVGEPISDGKVVETRYQIELWREDWDEKLNVVVIVHTRNGKCGHAVLFSTDLNLSADQIVDYYRLRFQIEFTFRDAKQHWGLEGFMNVTPTAVCVSQR